jgi:hypothetical protein
MNSELAKILKSALINKCSGCRYHSGIYCDKPSFQVCTEQVKALQKAIEDRFILTEIGIH